MRALLGLVLVAVLATVAASSAGSAQDARDMAIRSVISRQLEAFQRDDGSGAFAIASPSIQQIFRTPETFLDMVRRGYPQVYRPRSVKFGELIAAGGKLLQRVLIEGPDGRIDVAVYEMVEIDGQWRINGCTIAAAPEEDA